MNKYMISYANIYNIYNVYNIYNIYIKWKL